jgi:hypothetical protein
MMFYTITSHCFLHALAPVWLGPLLNSKQRPLFFNAPHLLKRLTAHQCDGAGKISPKVQTYP